MPASGRCDQRVPAAPTRWSSAAAPSAPGARGSCAGPGWSGWCCVEAGTLGQGREQPGRRAWSGPRAAPRPPSGSGCSPRLLPRPARRSSASTPGFVEQGYCMPCFTEAEVAAAHERIAMQQRARARRALARAGRVRRAEPARSRRGSPSARRTPPGDGYIDPPRNVARLHRGAGHAPASRCASTPPFTGLATAGGRVDRVRTSAGRRSPPAASCSPAARARRGRAAGRGRGSRPAARGTRSSSPSRTRTWRRTGCRWSSTWPSGIYWRPEEGGLLWGMSNPDEPPGEAPRVRRATTSTAMRARVAELVPVTARARAAHGLGRDHRLHARPPADPRPGARRRRAGRRHGRRRRRRPRDDVGPRRRPGRRRPRAHRHHRRASTSPTSASTASTPTAAAAWPPTRSPCPSRRGPHS